MIPYHIKFQSVATISNPVANCHDADPTSESGQPCERCAGENGVQWRRHDHLHQPQHTLGGVYSGDGGDMPLFA